MRYPQIRKGTFISRPNRFIAYVNLNGETVTCHVKNTGRCRELLVPGSQVILQYHPDAAAQGRKTEYSLVEVYKEMPGSEPLLINMDSQAPNLAAFEWLSGQAAVRSPRREVSFGNSRFDMAFLWRSDLELSYAETKQQLHNEDPSLWKQAYMEVKGVTLEDKGIARFPDAPTLRGLKHVEELAAMAEEGIPCFLLFVVQMKSVSIFEPNMEMQPEFGLALSRAAKAGVHILAYDCLVTEDSMTIDQPVPIRLPALPPL